MTSMPGKEKPRTKLTDDQIVAELRAFVRRRLSEQATNAKETEAGFVRLSYKRRKKVTEQINKRFPTVLSEPRKKNKDIIKK